MNEELYEKMELAFAQYGIEDPVEDVLLELAEILSDKGQTGQEVRHKEKYGTVTVEICGICTWEPEEPEELAVLVKWLKIGNQEFKIDDYLL